jgi:hypothetical protein
MLRGREAGFLSLTAQPDEARALGLLRQRWLRPDRHQQQVREQFDLALTDGYARLLAPALENETLTAAKERADAEAIAVFAENLRELLLAAPYGRKAVLAVDPGLRTGCKTVALSDQGTLLANTTIFPHEPRRRDEAAQAIRALITKHQPQAIAVGKADEVMLRWSEIERMQADGCIETHSHTHSHVHWDQLHADQGERLAALEQDLLRSREALHRRLGGSNAHLCWPWGYFEPEYQAIASKLGFINQYTVA